MRELKLLLNLLDLLKIKRMEIMNNYLMRYLTFI
jgi:hypothetical protein